MLPLAAGLALLALASSPESVTPPTPGGWHQLGATTVSHPGKRVQIFRTAISPQAVAIVITSPSAQTIRVTWSTDCEVVSDDEMESQQQGKTTGLNRIVITPPVLTGATRCYLFATATLAGHTQAKLSAAAFYT